MDFLAAAFDLQNLKHHLSLITFLPLVGAGLIPFKYGESEEENRAPAGFFFPPWEVTSWGARRSTSRANA